MPIVGQKKFIVTGVSKIDKKLRELPLKIEKKIVRKAIRESLKSVQKEAKSQSPRDTGRMMKAIVVRVAKSQKRGEILQQVRISSKGGSLVRGTKKGPQKAFYPAIVEYGARGKKASSLVRLFVAKARVFAESSHPPNPFMYRAYRSKGKYARNQALKLILAGIEKEARS